MDMHKPSHPGLVLREYLGETSVTEAAEHLSITRATLSRIINGKAAISADMAIKLSLLLPYTTPTFWANMQTQYDLWKASQRPHTVQPLVAVHA